MIDVIAKILVRVRVRVSVGGEALPFQDKLRVTVRLVLGLVLVLVLR